MKFAESEHFINTIQEHCRSKPNTSVKLLTKHWLIHVRRTYRKQFYTITMHNSPVGRAIRYDKVWRAVKLQNQADLFVEFGLVIECDQRKKLITACAEAERSVIVKYNH